MFHIRVTLWFSLFPLSFSHPLIIIIVFLLTPSLSLPLLLFAAFLLHLHPLPFFSDIHSPSCITNLLLPQLRIPFLCRSLSRLSFSSTCCYLTSSQLAFLFLLYTDQSQVLWCLPSPTPYFAWQLVIFHRPTSHTVCHFPLLLCVVCWIICVQEIFLLLTQPMKKHSFTLIIMTEEEARTICCPFVFTFTKRYIRLPGNSKMISNELSTITYKITNIENEIPI